MRTVIDDELAFKPGCSCKKSSPRMHFYRKLWVFDVDSTPYVDVFSELILTFFLFDGMDLPL